MAPNSELRAGFYVQKHASVFCCLMQNARFCTRGARSSVFSPGPCVFVCQNFVYCVLVPFSPSSVLNWLLV